ncbi:MAG TPA: 2-hydroxyacid dehydrogenase [Clostridia bacterium]|nr:2-hydroxyacid dehydrogenase [Clostridia bacterium]
MKIVMLEPLGVSEDTVMSLAKPFIDQGHEFVFCGKRIETEEEVISRAAGANVFIIANSPLSGKVIHSAPDLKMISVAFTGVDHVDKAACTEKNILVSNAQGYCTDAVAELAFGLMLSALRNVIPCNARTREGSTKDGLVGNELHGKTIGIIGTGAIGRRVAEIAKVFGCKVLGYSRTQNEEAKSLGIEYLPLDELLKQSDIVSLHIPLTNETKNLISKERLALMKPSSILINTARGAVVDNNALAEALNEGRIAGAGIDVFEMEPPIPVDHPLTSSKNTILTPHIAFATKESMFRRAQITFNNISAWMAGKPENVKIQAE